MSWNLYETYELTKKICDEQQSDAVKNYIDSMERKFKMMQYHRGEFRKVISHHFVNKPDATLMEVSTAHFDKISNALEGDDSYYKDSLCAEAHLNGYAQVMHSLADIFAKILTLLLLPEVEDELNLYKIVKQTKSTLPSISQEIDELLNSTEFGYLRAYTNTIKHHNLVDFQASMNFGTLQNGLRIKKFDYQPKSPRGAPKEIWEAKYAQDFLDQEHSSLNIKISNIVVNLNNHLKSKLSE